MAKLIGINGRRGAGKDTAYGFIREAVEHQGLRAERRAFADPLKVSAARALGFEGDTEECVALCNRLKDKGLVVTIIGDTPKQITGREFLQRYGTESHRDVFGSNFWVDAILPLGGDPVAGNHWTNRFDNADIAVVTDVRFPNEAERVLDLGGEVWEIQRTSCDANPDAHDSEKPLPEDLVTQIIVNDASLDDFCHEVESALAVATVGML